MSSVSAGLHNVSCDFQKPHICGYTTGSCWNSDVLFRDAYGKGLFSVIVDRRCFEKKLYITAKSPF